jgi:hypothetical protein
MSLPASAAAHPVLSAAVGLGAAGLLAAPFAVALQVGHEDAAGTVLSLPALSGGPRAALDRLARLQLPAEHPQVRAAAAQAPVAVPPATHRDVDAVLEAPALRRTAVAVRAARTVARTVTAVAPVTATAVASTASTAAPSPTSAPTTAPTTTAPTTTAPTTTVTATAPTTAPAAEPTTTPTEAPAPPDHGAGDVAVGAGRPSYDGTR